MLAGGSILPRGRGRPASLVQERRRVSCTLEAKCAVDRRVASRVKLTESRFREKMGGRGGGEGGGKQCGASEFFRVERFSSGRSFGRIGKRLSPLESLSLYLCVSELFNSPPFPLYLLGRLGERGGGIIGREYYVEAFLKNGRSNIMELP